MTVVEGVVTEAPPDDVTIKVKSLREHLDSAVCLDQIREVVIEAGTLVAEGKLPMLLARFLVCHAQTRLTFLNNKV
ncbi:MAG: hypothetical protein AAB622_01890 [Patescibacteria group bacterium]